MNFSLHVVEAKDLVNTGTIRTSDPFCQINIGNETRKTKPITNTVNPRWDETFSFQNVPSESRIVFDILDKNLISSNEIMGRFETTVSKLKENPRAWYPLFGKKGESTLGQVYLEANFV